MTFRGSVSEGNRPRVFGLLSILALALSLSIVPARAQTSTAGTVAGQVTDATQAAIPGAAVKLFDPRTNAAMTTVTNDVGRYVFPSVPPGIYDLTFTKDGFSTYEVRSQAVDVGLALTVNAPMKVGTTATTVEVTASTGAELQTMNATVGNTLNGEALYELPNMGRDVTSFAVLQPATVRAARMPELRPVASRISTPTSSTAPM